MGFGSCQKEKKPKQPPLAPLNCAWWRSYHSWKQQGLGSVTLPLWGKALGEELQHGADSLGVTPWSTPRIGKVISSANFSLSKAVVQVRALLRWLHCPWPLQPWLCVRHGAAAAPSSPAVPAQLSAPPAGEGHSTGLTHSAHHHSFAFGSGFLQRPLMTF